jgi:iron(III) transport system ATP-binding protein
MIKVPVTLKNVTKRFGEGEDEIVAVDNFTYDFEAGKLVTLLGPSGCGKTTTLRCIAGFYEPEEGDIFLGGERVNHLPPYRRPTGTVFQNYALFPHMTVFENVAYGLKIKKLPEREIKKKVAQGLDLLQLGGMEDRRPDQLSGGQQQRVAIARVLVNEPQVLLFDEPLSNLDAKLRVYMRGEIRSLQENLGITTIYVTHDQEEAMSISDIMVVMNEGRIEQVGSPQEIYRKSATTFVADFIGLTNFLKGRVKDIHGDLLSVSVYDALVELKVEDSFEIGEEVTIVTRPEMLRFSKEGPSNLRGVVKNVFFLGSLARYEIEIGKGELITLDDSNPINLTAKGSDVYIEIFPGSAHVKRG